jgi:hypothetical protein
VTVDSSERGDYIVTKHQVTPTQADEALNDPDRLVLDPDPASRSGVGVRTIGYCASRDELLSVITVEEGGVIFGVNAWPSNPRDQRKYREGGLQ